MKRIKQLTTTLLIAALGLATLAPSTFASSDLVYKTNTAQVEVKVNRDITGLGQNYESHSGKFTLINKDTTPLKNWTLEFDYDGEIYSVSNAVLVRRVDNHYTITAPKTWNQTILQGRTLGFEFVGKKTANDLDINNVLFYTNERPVKVTVIQTWALKATYAKGSVVTYNGKNYKCVQAHTAHASNWTPNLTPALWSIDRTPAPKALDVLFTK